MSPSLRKIPATQVLVVLLATAAVVHFVLSLVTWGRLLVSVGVPRAVLPPEFWLRILAEIWPAMLFLAASVVAFIFAFSRLRMAAALLVLILLGSAGSLAYDTFHHRYQVQAMTMGEGCLHFYCTWWWWDDRACPHIR